MFWHFRCAALRKLRRSAGQATVEAALLLPIVFLGTLISAQPAIVLYDRLVMQAAASEGCRVLETLPEGQEDTAREYVQRRLAAIPDVDIFHKGEWAVELSGAGQADAQVTVRISHNLEALPLMAAGLSVTGLADDSGAIQQQVDVSESLRDTWVLESEFGSNYQDWIDRWQKGV